jgi:hypothetical protein
MRETMMRNVLSKYVFVFLLRGDSLLDSKTSQKEKNSERNQNPAELAGRNQYHWPD